MLVFDDAERVVNLHNARMETLHKVSAASTYKPEPRWLSKEASNIKTLNTNGISERFNDELEDYSKYREQLKKLEAVEIPEDNDEFNEKYAELSAKLEEKGVELYQFHFAAGGDPNDASALLDSILNGKIDAAALKEACEDRKVYEMTETL